MSQRILIIDDDVELCELLADFLQLEGFEVASLHDGGEALQRIDDIGPDAVVLDIMLPGMQGLEVLRQLRERTRLPVIMLTARGEDNDRILGLELGADDYLPKPCNPRELAARLRAVLRRAMPDQSGDDALTVGATRLDASDRSASHAGRDLKLTSAEFNVLQVLLQNAGQVVDKETLSREALGRPLNAYDRSIDVHVSKIRRKLSAQGGAELIVSVRGAGYQFVQRQQADD
jgi:DNA-binding response OmpR family regulator